MLKVKFTSSEHPTLDDFDAVNSLRSNFYSETERG